MDDANEDVAWNLFSDIPDGLPIDLLERFGNNWNEGSSHCVETLQRHLVEAFLPNEALAIAMAAFSLYVTEEGDPARLCALCVSETVLATWVGHIRFLMQAR
eukprot:2101036-Alexandrium_andersonii.AAC.1